MHQDSLDRKQRLGTSVSGSQLDRMASQAVGPLSLQGQQSDGQALGVRSFSDPPISFDQRALKQRNVLPSSQAKHSQQQLYKAEDPDTVPLSIRSGSTSSLSEQRGLSSSWTHISVPEKPSRSTSGYRVYSNAYTAGRSSLSSGSHQSSGQAPAWGSEASSLAAYGSPTTSPHLSHALAPTLNSQRGLLQPPASQAGQPAGKAACPPAQGGQSLTVAEAVANARQASALSAALHAARGMNQPYAPPQWLSGAELTQSGSTDKPILRDSPKLSGQANGGSLQTAAAAGQAQRDALVAAIMRSRQQSDSSALCFAGSQGSSNTDYLMRCLQASAAQRASTAPLEQHQRTLQALQETLARTELQSHSASLQMQPSGRHAPAGATSAARGELAQHGRQLSAGAQGRVKAGAAPTTKQQPQQAGGELGISEAIAHLQRIMPGGNSAPPAGLSGVPDQVDLASLKAAVRAFGKSKSLPIHDAAGLHPRKYRRSTSPPSLQVGSLVQHQPFRAPLRFPELSSAVHGEAGASMGRHASAFAPLKACATSQPPQPPHFNPFEAARSADTGSKHNPVAASAFKPPSTFGGDLSAMANQVVNLALRQSMAGAIARLAHGEGSGSFDSALSRQLIQGGYQPGAEHAHRVQHGQRPAWAGHPQGLPPISEARPSGLADPVSEGQAAGEVADIMRGVQSTHSVQQPVAAPAALPAGNDALAKLAAATVAEDVPMPVANVDLLAAAATEEANRARTPGTKPEAATAEESTADMLMLAAQTLVAMTVGSDGSTRSSRSSSRGSGSDRSHQGSPTSFTLASATSPQAGRRRRRSSPAKKASAPAPLHGDPSGSLDGQAHAVRDRSGSGVMLPHPVLGMVVPLGKRRS